MRSIKSILVGLVSSIALVACTVGVEDSGTTSTNPVRYVDSNGDGVADGVDTDGDGDKDRDFQTPNSSLPPGGVPVCDDPLVDSDNDGDWDGLDLDCDGNIDIPFSVGGPATPPTNGGNTCNVTISNNGDQRQVTCANGTCECRANDVLEKTCTENAQSCSFPGNCCGY